ncbi:MAG: hypothetical protein M3R15_28125, partial [Acidobacteriota bacterium]|nr:hypothetical protein [Acidobacteriota bacterium]
FRAAVRKIAIPTWDEKVPSKTILVPDGSLKQTWTPERQHLAGHYRCKARLSQAKQERGAKK